MYFLCQRELGCIRSKQDKDGSSLKLDPELKQSINPEVFEDKRADYILMKRRRNPILKSGDIHV